MSKTVAEFMTHGPITVHPETTLTDVIRILAERRISGLPVVDATSKLLGVVSETDLMWQATDVTPPAYIMVLDSVIYLDNPGRYERDLHKALGQTVADIMSYQPVTIGPEQPLSMAAHLMHDRQVHRLPVVNADGAVIGILTRGDIVRSLASTEAEVV